MAEISSHSIVVSGGSNRYTNNDAWANTATWTGGTTTTTGFISSTAGWVNTF